LLAAGEDVSPLALKEEHRQWQLLVNADLEFDHARRRAHDLGHFAVGHDQIDLFSVENHEYEILFDLARREDNDQSSKSILLFSVPLREVPKAVGLHQFYGQTRLRTSEESLESETSSIVLPIPFVRIPPIFAFLHRCLEDRAQ